MKYGVKSLIIFNTEEDADKFEHWILGWKLQGLEVAEITRVNVVTGAVEMGQPVSDGSVRLSDPPGDDSDPSLVPEYGSGPRDA